MATSATPKRRGRKMNLSSTRALLAITELLDPMVAVFEALKNAFEAKPRVNSPQIDIFPDDEGMVCMRDNCAGIPLDKMIAVLGDFGASTKRIGAGEGENFGWGISLTGAALNPENGCRIISWTDGDSSAHQILIGVNSDGELAVLDQDGGAALVKVKKPVATKSGTEVHFGDLPYSRDEVAFAISEHFIEFPEGAVVRVHDTDPARSSRSNPSEVKALVSTLVAKRDTTLGFETWGCFETLHAYVTWVILDSKSKHHAGVYQYWNNEVCSKSSSAGVSAEFGIYAAQQQIVFVIRRQNTKGEKKLVPDLHRQNVKNWHRTAATYEVSKAIPDAPLGQYMREWERVHYSEMDDTEVEKTLVRWRTGKSQLDDEAGTPTEDPGTSEVDPGKGGGTKPNNNPKPGPGGGGGGKPGGGNGKPNGKPKRKTGNPAQPTGDADANGVRMIGTPTCRFSTKADMGNQFVRYVPGRNVILINAEVGRVKELLEEAKTQRKYGRTVQLIKAHMVDCAVEFFRHTGMLPGQIIPGTDREDGSLLQSALSPSAALEFVYKTPSKSRKPKAT